MSEAKFNIKVRTENYEVEPEFKDELNVYQYSISTDCNYIMTIYRDDDGTWSALTDVQVMDDDLVEEIGTAVELHQTKPFDN